MRKRLTLTTFIEKANKTHNSYYDYSLSEYVDYITPIKIICPTHGEFKQIPRNHLRYGCKECGVNKRSDTLTLNVNNFIDKANKIHNNIYNYSLVNYKTSKINVTVICSKHGKFKVTPNNHLKGSGCPQCGHECKSKFFSDTKESFIEKGKKKHNNLYDYSLINYVDIHSNVDFICLTHGIFKQKPKNHLSGSGCPICKQSKGEMKIYNILKGNVLFERQKTFKNCINKIRLPFDFYVPSQNLLIEYDGEQHFKAKDFFGGAQGFKERQKNDGIKNKYAKQNGIRLLRISYLEYDKIDEILSALEV